MLGHLSSRMGRRVLCSVRRLPVFWSTGCPLSSLGKYLGSMSLRNFDKSLTDAQRYIPVESILYLYLIMPFENFMEISLQK
jgi:hypothetical protein